MARLVRSFPKRPLLLNSAQLYILIYGWVVFDTAAASDVVVRGAMLFSRTVSDGAAASDSITQYLSFARGLNETITGSDADTAHVVDARTVTETLAGSDAAIGSAAKLQSRSVSDTAPATEQPSFQRTAYLSTQLVAESIGVVDAAIGIVNNARSTFVTETVQALEAVHSFTSQRLNDSAPASDSAKCAYIRNVTEVSAAIDVPSENVSYGSNTSDNAFGTLLSGLNQLDIATCLYPRAATDTLAATDTAAGNVADVRGDVADFALAADAA